MVAHSYPTPLWLRLWRPTPEVRTAWQDLVAAGELAHVEGPEEDGYARIALRVPRGVEVDLVVADLVRQVKRALDVLPVKTPADEARDPEPEEPPVDDPAV